tara:strand:- start:93 stop:200 length:108 start_codon:yes stop_codon:yes gene_type:complete
MLITAKAKQANIIAIAIAIAIAFLAIKKPFAWSEV